MRRTALIAVVLAACAGTLFAQDSAAPQFLAEAGLSEQEVKELTRVFDETEAAIREARVEMDVLKAQLRRLLFKEAEKVDMREVERLMRSSLEWELKERMAQVRRQVELRRVLGDRRYARLGEQLRERFGRERGAQDERGPGPARGGPWTRP